MNYTKRPKLEIDDINRRTDRNVHRVNDLINRLELLQKDYRKEARLAAHECRTCFYLNQPKIVGHAFSHWNCRVCGKIEVHANTGVPSVCMDCAKKHGLCTECGADLDDKKNRREL